MLLYILYYGHRDKLLVREKKNDLSRPLLFILEQ